MSEHLHQVAIVGVNREHQRAVARRTALNGSLDGEQWALQDTTLRLFESGVITAEKQSVSLGELENIVHDTPALMHAVSNLNVAAQSYSIRRAKRMTAPHATALVTEGDPIIDSLANMPAEQNWQIEMNRRYRLLVRLGMSTARTVVLLDQPRGFAYEQYVRGTISQQRGQRSALIMLAEQYRRATRIARMNDVQTVVVSTGADLALRSISETVLEAVRGR